MAELEDGRLSARLRFGNRTYLLVYNYVLVFAVLIALTIVTFGVSATDGPLQVALMLSAAFASLVSCRWRVSGSRTSPGWVQARTPPARWPTTAPR